jgi:hypothetical protein
MLSRTVTLPVPHLPAEIAAWPIVSEEAFRTSLLDLSPVLAPPTSRLWRDAEKEILLHAPGISIDQILAMRDELWFISPSHASSGLCPVSAPFKTPQGAPNIPLGMYLSRLAKRSLSPAGMYAEPRCFFFDRHGSSKESALSSAVWQWRWISFALPPDLLLAALGPVHTLPGRVFTLTPQFRRKLKDHGFAEVHLHLGAALDFSTLWISLVLALADDSLGEGAFQSPGALLHNGRDFGPWLIRAAIARMFLAWFLSSGRNNYPSFLSYLNGSLSALTKNFTLCLQKAQHTHSALIELSNGAFGKKPPNWAVLQNIYQTLVAGWSWHNPRPTKMDAFFQLDPIARTLPPCPNHGPSAEMRLISLALEYMSGSGKQDIGFARVFWQMVRIRCLFYRHIIQRPMTPGLQWFIRHYARISPARSKVTPALRVRSAAQVSGVEYGLVSLEARITVETSDASNDGLSITVDLLRSIFNAAKKIKAEAQCPKFEFGLVVHFAKDRGKAARLGLNSAFRLDKAKNNQLLNKASIDQPDTIPPWLNFNHLRFGNFFRNKLEEMHIFCDVLKINPSFLYLVRGVDICTDELAVPTWVMKPLFEMAREAGHKASLALQHQGQKVPPLGVTAHTGEDYAHLLNGLRRVEEAMFYLASQRGDRLGHALALGQDPHAWAASCGSVAMPIETRMLDLLWEWGMYSREEAAATGERRGYIEKEIARLSLKIFGCLVSPFCLSNAMTFIHKTCFLSAMGFFRGVSLPSSKQPWRNIFPPKTQRLLDAPDATSDSQAWRSKFPFGDPDPKHLAALYLGDTGVFLRGREVEYVKTIEEASALDSLQKALRRKAAQRGITVEVNPSSNLLIGNVGDFRQHPLWRMTMPEGEDAALPVRIAIGSDDPLTFATTLPDEYQLLWETLKNAGLSDKDTEEWLDRVRENGLSSRFTLPWPENLSLDWNWSGKMARPRHPSHP